ncbi:proliferating cell nuclear antigen (pcna) [Candidatus Micrarchaeota archaeon]|nr:proliferating cell nuclear antigen (pcna) [Candidatus Micrarchaeota archaeon]
MWRVVCMFEITVDDAKFWKNCVDAIANLVDEGTFEVKEDCIQLKAMDPSQIAMVVFSAPKTSFSIYSVTSAGKISLNIDSLSKILARSRSNEKLSMHAEENKLELEFSSENNKRSFKVPLIDIPAGAQKEPKIEHDARILLKPSAFKEVLKDAALLSSHLTLEATSDGFTIDVKGDSADLLAQSANVGDVVQEMQAKNKARATFPLQYLDDMVKACPDDAQLVLNLKTNTPLKIEYAIGEAKIAYYLAPRIEAE